MFKPNEERQQPGSLKLIENRLTFRFCPEFGKDINGEARVTNGEEAKLGQFCLKAQSDCYGASLVTIYRDDLHAGIEEIVNKTLELEERKALAAQELKKELGVQ